jgi:hypothetical protein
MSYTPKTKSLYKRFAIGYSGILGMVLVALGFSIAQGTGWKPVLVGLPVYLTFFVVVTYKLIKELRALKREEQGVESPIDDDEQ